MLGRVLSNLAAGDLGPGGRSEGQGLAEYALLLALIAVVAIASLLFLGTGISSLLSQIGEFV